MWTESRTNHTKQQTTFIGIKRNNVQCKNPMFYSQSGTFYACVCNLSTPGGECLPGARPARYFSINYPDFSPRFTLPWRSPPSRPHCTAHLPYKARFKVHMHAFQELRNKTQRNAKQKRNDDCPGFLNHTGRLGPKRGRKCYITPAFSGVPNEGDKIRSQNLRRGSP